MIFDKLYTPNCIRTNSGNYLDLQNPKPEQINLRDIAWGLAHTPRWGGQYPTFLSVAEHSINVATSISKALSKQRRYALLHDASEAYLGDIPSPIKALLPDYKELETMIQQAIYEKFDLKDFSANLLNEPFMAELAQADKEQLELEWAAWLLHEKSSVPCKRLKPEQAYHLFLETYEGWK